MGKKNQRDTVLYFNKRLNKEPLLHEAMTIPKTILREQKWKNSLLCGAQRESYFVLPNEY